MKKIALLAIPMICLCFTSPAQSKISATPVYDNVHHGQKMKHAKNPTCSAAQNNDPVPTYTPQKLSDNANQINLKDHTTTHTGHIKKVTFKNTNYRRSPPRL